MIERKIVQDSLERALNWAWRIRNHDNGWGPKPYTISQIHDHSELFYPLLTTVLDSSSQFARESMSYIHNYFEKGTWRNGIPDNELSRRIVWTTLCLLERGEAKDLELADKALTALGRYREDGKGWASFPGYRSNVDVTFLNILAHMKKGIAEKEVQDAARWISSIQNPDGGWGFYEGTISDYKPTAVCLLALLQTNGDKNVIKKAAQWLLDNQLESGRWHLSYEPDIALGNKRLGGKLNPGNIFFQFSTPWSLLALLKSGENSSSPPIQTATRYLLEIQDQGGGWSFCSREEGYNLYSKEMILATWATGASLLALHEYLERTK